MLSHRCVRCKWFDNQHESLENISNQIGYCRKHKPVIYAKENRYYGGWPLVHKEDFCGEFREDKVDGMSE